MNFKNKIFGIFLLSFLCLNFACKKALIETKPMSSLTDVNAYNTSSDIDLAVLGIYNILQSRVPTDYSLMAAAADNNFAEYFAVNPGLTQIWTLSVTSDNQKLNDFWKSNYRGIFLANKALENSDLVEGYTGDQKNNLVGEIKFLRAKFYFDLVRIFGDVPLLKNAVSIQESLNIGRSPEQEVYNFIIDDLKDAFNGLPEPADAVWGRASKGGALALLGKVYVTLKDWPNAKTTFDSFFQKYGSYYSLVSDYNSIFTLAGEKNSETIIVLSYASGTDGHGLTTDLAPLQGVINAVENGNRVLRPSWSLRKLFLKEDTRLAATISDSLLTFADSPGDTPAWWPYFTKWIVPGQPRGASGLDIPILRLSDVMLLYAETLYHSSDKEGALSLINRVRERAFGNSLHDYVLQDINNEDDFYNLYLNERRLELAMENQRWFDLVRTDRFVQVLNHTDGDYTNPINGGTIVKKAAVAQPYMKVFPIPQEQIDLANPGVLSQNLQY